MDGCIASQPLEMKLAILSKMSYRELRKIISPNSQLFNDMIKCKIMSEYPDKLDAKPGDISYNNYYRTLVANKYRPNIVDLNHVPTYEFNVIDDKTFVVYHRSNTKTAHLYRFDDHQIYRTIPSCIHVATYGDFLCIDAEISSIERNGVVIRQFNAISLKFKLIRGHLFVLIEIPHKDESQILSGYEDGVEEIIKINGIIDAIDRHPEGFITVEMNTYITIRDSKMNPLERYSNMQYKFINPTDVTYFKGIAYIQNDTTITVFNEGHGMTLDIMESAYKCVKWREFIIFMRKNSLYIYEPLTNLILIGINHNFSSDYNMNLIGNNLYICGRSKAFFVWHLNPEWSELS